MTSLKLVDIVADELAKVGQLLSAERSRHARTTTFAPDLPGFATRTYASGRSVYIVQARMGGAMRTVTLGSTEVLSLRLARDVARRVLLRAQTGENPADSRVRARAAPPWTIFLGEYWRRMEAGWKPSTRRSQGIYRRQHLDRAFVGKFIDEIDEEDVTRWFAETTARSGPGAANRTLDILASLFAKAEAWGYRAPNRNPCRYVRRNRQRKHERFLSDEELARLGTALRAFETIDPARVAALKLILLTGCRKS